MATILERPLSALRSSVEPIVPQRRRRESTEVIDVDSFDEQPPQRRRRLGSPEIISLIDSDDETHFTSPSSRRQVNRLVSPPPPLPNDSGIPPVPHLPFALAPYASLPFRRGRNLPNDATLLGVVRANERPFEFEDGFDYIIPAEPGLPEPGLREAGPSRPRHHGRQPLPRGHMGLGGALIASNSSQRTQRIMDAAARSRRQRNNVSVEVPRRRNALRIVDLNGPDDLLFRADFEEPPNIRFLFGPPLRDPLQEIEYKTEYTHPDGPDAGFTHDFEVAPVKVNETSNNASSLPTSSQANPIFIDDEDDEIIDLSVGSTSRSTRAAEPPPNMSTALVCAMCLTSLVMGAQAAEARVWGLRCGHLIDGACLAKISIPSDALLAPLLDDDPKGKGKAKAKAKARDVEPSHTLVSRLRDPFGENPIRSRLRSANNNQHSDEGGQSLLDRLIPTFINLRKSRVKKPKVEAQHQWECPVSGCGRMHTSVRIDGVWTQEKELGEGAIGLFL